jgi:hypothetical protein
MISRVVHSDRDKHETEFSELYVADHVVEYVGGTQS